MVDCNQFLFKVQPKIQKGNLITPSQVFTDQTALQVMPKVDNFYKSLATFAQGTIMKLVNGEQMGLVNMLEVGNMSQNCVTFVQGTATILESADSMAGTMGGQSETFGSIGTHRAHETNY